MPMIMMHQLEHKVKLLMTKNVWPILSTCSLMTEESIKSAYDVVVVGAGHNGLIAANYLQRSGLRVCVLERRHLVGGAAVTEEIIPGFKFSRASYLLSLLRPQIIEDLQLKKYGLKIHLRNPSSYTPINRKYWHNQSTNEPKSLLLGLDPDQNRKEIAKFSVKDSFKFESYEKMMSKFVEALDPLIDIAPPKLNQYGRNGYVKNTLPSLIPLLKMGWVLGKDAFDFYELCTAPVAKVLNKWFESDILKATIATDTLIGTMASCKLPSSNGYVLLHHVMGEIEGTKGAWGYPEGGMGAVSQALAKSAQAAGVHIFVNQEVKSVLTSDETSEKRNVVAQGVVTVDGRRIRSKAVVSNATPQVSFFDLLDKESLHEDFRTEVKGIDYTSPVTKINVALKKLPNFEADPNGNDGEMKMRPHHQCTIHLNCENMNMLEDAYQDALNGNASKRPMLEMVIPSALDKTIAPDGCHVCLIFSQFTPYKLENGQRWTEKTKQEYANRVFEQIEEYAPGFKDSIVGYEILTPPDLEDIFGLTGGNIFHGKMSLDQLFMMRPTKYSGYSTPISGYYMCGSGTHPGGGVMGAPGRNAASIIINDMRKKKN